MSENLTTLNIKIDADLKNDFKLQALKNKETMTDVVVKAIKSYIEQENE